MKVDTNKWKSVLLPREVYDQLYIVSKVEGRTLSGQLRLIFEHWVNENLSQKDRAYLLEQVEEKRIDEGRPRPEFT
jgi:predicted DNA-binding protein|tara:strand:+ start:311 stop:538 length:228 start_codon:yes stop_codon:yes gene_type:complete